MQHCYFLFFVDIPSIILRPDKYNSVFKADTLIIFFCFFSDANVIEKILLKSSQRKDENVKINSQNGQVQYATLQV